MLCNSFERFQCNLSQIVIEPPVKPALAGSPQSRSCDKFVWIAEIDTIELIRLRTMAIRLVCLYAVWQSNRNLI
jgi:hypothetical protein